jgi:hypothetical protein
MRPDYDLGEEFEYGLTVILDALARELAAKTGGAKRRARPPTRASVAAVARPALLRAK